MSSNMTPQPPGITCSIFLHPNGLKMSIIRKSAKPMKARSNVYSPHGAAKSGIHVPTYSSITTARGSGPQYCSITLEVHTPITVTATISPMVAQSKVRGLRTRYNPYHISKATKAAAVPGHMESDQYKVLWKELHEIEALFRVFYNCYRSFRY